MVTLSQAKQAVKSKYGPRYVKMVEWYFNDVEDEGSDIGALKRMRPEAFVRSFMEWINNIGPGEVNRIMNIENSAASFSWNNALFDRGLKYGDRVAHRVQGSYAGAGYVNTILYGTIIKRGNKPMVKLDSGSISAFQKLMGEKITIDTCHEGWRKR